MIAAGDIGRCDSSADDATGALVASLPGVVATLGDTAYEDGTMLELEECFGGSWGGVKDRIRFAATGNHDMHTDSGEPLQAYMGSAAAQDGRTWFSDDLGAWHVVVLDTNCGLFGGRCASESEQVGWLREDLQAAGARCTLALMHQPRFSSGQHGDDRALARSGTSCTRRTPSWSSVVTTTTTSASPLRRPTARRTTRVASCSSSSVLVAPTWRGSRRPGRTPWSGSTTRTGSLSSRSARIRGRSVSSMSLAWHATQVEGRATDRGVISWLA